MLSSTLIKSLVALALVVHASAFAPPSSIRAGTVTVATVEQRPPVPIRQCTICHATDKKNKNGMGIGGLNFGQVPSSAKSPKVARAPPKTKKGAATKTGRGGKQDKNNSKKLAPGPPADIDWGKVILAFLTPWRNPNSIFLYMLLIVSVLGKVNEVPQ